MQPNGRSYSVNKSYPGIGRVQLATGTKDRRTAQKMEAMLDTLYSTGKGRFIEELKQRRFTLPWLFTAFNAGQLDTLVSSATAQPFASILDWIEKNPEFAPSTRRSYRSLAAKLVSLYPSRKVHDIPDMLRDFRAQCVAHEPPIQRGFNQTRSLCQAFARDTVGKHTPLWIAISNVEMVSYTVNSGKKLTYADAVALTGKFLGSKSSDKKADVMILWSLLLTGMRKSEYLGTWSVLTDRITVRSAKERQTGARERFIPLVSHAFSPVPPWDITVEIGMPFDPGPRFQTFERRLRKLTANGVSPHDLRHTFRTWMLLAGIPEVRAEAYMGHKLNAKNVSKLYTWHDVEPYLTEDAQRMHQWLNEQELHWQTFENPHSEEYRAKEDPELVYEKTPHRPKHPPKKKSA